MAATTMLELDDESAAIVAEAVGSGAFQAAGDVIRAALQTWKAAESDLKAAIEEGMSSGEAIPAEDVFAELESRYRGMLSRQA